MQSTDAVRALAALAYESRLAVFRCLVEAGPGGLPAGVLAERLHVAPSALSFHLKDLTYSELLVHRSMGRRIIYSANFAAMERLIAYLTENCCRSAQSTRTASGPGPKQRRMGLREA